MNPNTSIIAAAMLLATLPSCGSSAPPKGKAAATPATPEAVAAAAPYRMSGAALMMTPGEVQTALSAAGFSPKPSDLINGMGRSFEDRVEERVTGKPVAHPVEVPYLQDWRKGRELIQVRYGAFPGGPRVVDYHWETGDASPSEDEIRTSLERRYGPGVKPKPVLPEEWCFPTPCSPASATLDPTGRQIELMAPLALSGDESDNRRVEAAARARQGDKHGSF